MNSSVRCRNFRTKSMYVPALAGEKVNEIGAPESLARSSHCWCNCTLTETGPDDQVVGPDRCNPSRSCFEE